MKKHTVLIVLALVISGCATWKHQTKLTGEGEVDLFYCKKESARLACKLGLEDNPSFLRKQIDKCMTQEHGWVKAKEHYIYPPRDHMFVSYLYGLGDTSVCPP